jgi:hypothetical protein
MRIPLQIVAEQGIGFGDAVRVGPLGILVAAKFSVSVQVHVHDMECVSAFRTRFKMLTAQE